MTNLPTAARASFATTLAFAASGLFASVALAQNGDAMLERASESRVKGAQEAPIFVYEFADFQCPHCSRFAMEVFPRIDSAFVKTGKVRWVFVNLPLPNHPTAWLAHEAALCAGAIGDRFWPLHDRIFGAQAEWGGAADAAAHFARYAREAGVAAEAWDECVANDRVAALLLQDVIFAASARVNGTPAFNINNELSVMGLKTFEEWKEILEKSLKKTRDR